MPQRRQSIAPPKSTSDLILTQHWSLIRVAFALLIAWMLFQVGISDSPVAQAAYYCGNAGSGHCYARSYWNESAKGAELNIQVVQMGCDYLSTGCQEDGVETGFIDNEMWLAQNPSYWVEAGYTTFSTNYNPTTVWYFWADYRPCTGCGYSNHYVRQVPSADYNHNVFIEINQDNNCLTCWDVGIFSYTLDISGQSTSNWMVPNRIYEGQELAGSYAQNPPPGAAWANTAQYTSSQWWNSSNNVWAYQTNAGTLNNTNPSVDGGYWPTPPNGSNHGGIWEDYCCQGH